MNNNERIWQTATDVRTQISPSEYVGYRLTHGNGTKLVGAHLYSSLPDVGSDSGDQCRPSGRCKQRCAAASLNKGHASEPKCATMEQLGKMDDWDGFETRGNSVAMFVNKG